MFAKLANPRPLLDVRPLLSAAEFLMYEAYTDSIRRVTSSIS